MKLALEIVGAYLALLIIASPLVYGLCRISGRISRVEEMERLDHTRAKPSDASAYQALLDHILSDPDIPDQVPDLLWGRHNRPDKWSN